LLPLVVVGVLGWPGRWRSGIPGFDSIWPRRLRGIF